MDFRLICLVIGLVLGAAIVVGFILQDIYLMRKVRRLTEQNAKLRKENIGLMRHNGKLYDENQELKSLTTENIPSFKPW